jgi:hypothetical protein
VDNALAQSKTTGLSGVSSLCHIGFEAG